MDAIVNLLPEKFLRVLVINFSPVISIIINGLMIWTYFAGIATNTILALQPLEFTLGMLFCTYNQELWARIVGFLLLGLRIFADMLFAKGLWFTIVNDINYFLGSYLIFSLLIKPTQSIDPARKMLATCIVLITPLITWFFIDVIKFKPICPLEEDLYGISSSPEYIWFWTIWEFMLIYIINGRKSKILLAFWLLDFGSTLLFSIYSQLDLGITTDEYISVGIFELTGGLFIDATFFWGVSCFVLYFFTSFFFIFFYRINNNILFNIQDA